MDLEREIVGEPLAWRRCAQAEGATARTSAAPTAALAARGKRIIATKP